jgi:DNA-binding beta-propeller fold protein YncE
MKTLFGCEVLYTSATSAIRGAAIAIGMSVGLMTAPAQQTRNATPSPGSRVYVLDLMPTLDGGRQIIAYDTVRMQLMRTISTGFGPDLELSPDGSRLFVISREATSVTNTLQVIDTSTWNQLDTQAVPHRLNYTVRPSFRAIAPSPDGHWLYIAIDDFTPPDRQAGLQQRDQYKVAMYNIDSHSFTAEIPVSDDCLGMDMLPASNGLYVFCSSSNMVYSYPLISGGLGSPRAISLPPKLRMAIGTSLTTATTTPIHPDLARGVLSNDELTLTVITSYLRAIQLNTVTGQVVSVKQIKDDRLATRDIVLSPDQTRIYIPMGLLSNYNGLPGVTQILVLETKTLNELATMNVAETFTNLNISADGLNLYAVSPGTHTIHVLDSSTGSEIRKLTNVGVTPSKIVLTRY